MAESGTFVTLIGDLVASRQVAGRATLQRSVNEVLAEANRRLRPLQPLEATVGDEFQGAFAGVAEAARASLLIRLALLMESEVDSRYGLGRGTVTVFEARRPISQDGPGWWAARGAIDRVAEMADANRGRTGFVRTLFVDDASESPRVTTPEADALNSFFLCRDAIVDQMRPRSRRLLLGLLLDQSQSRLAAEEGISQSAVSQDLAASGAYAISAAERELCGKSS